MQEIWLRLYPYTIMYIQKNYNLGPLAPEHPEIHSRLQTPEKYQMRQVLELGSIRKLVGERKRLVL